MKIENYKYSWENLNKDISKNLKYLKQKDFDVILTVYRGGLIPSVVLSNHLNLPIEIIKYQTRDGNKTINPLFNDFSYKKILLVEDIVDTGLTLSKVLLLHELHEKEITLFSLFAYDKIMFQLEFSNMIICNILNRENPKWIIFPWEKKEE